MKKLILFLALAFIMAGSAMAVKPTEVPKPKPFCGNEGFDCECQNFYNSTDYYSIAKFEPKPAPCTSAATSYFIAEQNTLYDYYDITVNGTAKSVSWTSDPDVYSALVKAGNDWVEYLGGKGSATSAKKAISHVTFCGKKNSNGGCTGPNCGNNGVPEFSLLTLGIATVAVTAGLVYLRKSG
jgi:hypothetical protein